MILIIPERRKVFFYVNSSVSQAASKTQPGGRARILRDKMGFTLRLVLISARNDFK